LNHAEIKPYCRAHETVVEIMVAGVAGIAKLYLDGNTHVLFYAGIILLLVLVACSIIVTGKIELHLTELSGL
jgi:hypothetical protein